MHRFRQSADPFSRNRPFSAFFTQWVCTLATTPPQVVTSPPPNGGNCTIRGATRRRQADSQLLMLQPPPYRQHGSRPKACRPCPQYPRATESRHRGTRAVPRREKTRPTGVTLPHLRDKTRPVRTKWPNLAGFIRAGRTLYRCHQQQAEQGELCTECELDAGLANTTAHQAPPVWRAPEGPQGLADTTQHRRRRRRGGRRRVRRARAGFEIDHSEPSGSRVAISRAAGPDGARNTSGATSNTSRKAAAHGHTKQPGPTTHHAAPGTPAAPQETQHRGAGPQARAPRRYDSDAAAQKY